MDNYLIVPITKSPHSKGRIGPVKMQDWYRGLAKAVLLQRKFVGSKILILSNVHIRGEEHEADIYTRALYDFGVKEENLLVIKDCYETIGQIDVIKQVAKEANYKLIFVSTWLHFGRVWWLTRGMKIKHYIAFGIPRPRESLTDIILTFMFPIIDILGKKEWFRKKVIIHREQGIF